jgi:membrane-bound lytic murein transglycosylase D
MLRPADKVHTFLANLERHELADKPLSNWNTYSLKKGEKLETVATRNGLTLARLKQLNGITPKSKIGPGYNLLIPANSQAQSDPVADSLPKMPSESRVAGRGKKGKKGAAKGSGKKQAGKTIAKGGRKAPTAKGKPSVKAKPAAKKKR